MASKRMISKATLNSGKFIMLPFEAQMLYVHLVVNADDDGFAEGVPSMRLLGLNPDMIQLLADKKFIDICDEDLVIHIVGFNEVNCIRADRKEVSQYAGIYPQFVNQMTTNCQRNDNQMTTNCQRNDRIDIDIVKDIDIEIEKKDKDTLVSLSKEKKAKISRHKYGQYQNVLLSDEELEKLKTEFPNDWNDRIEKLSAYMESTGKTYKSHLATIRVWAKNDKGKTSSSKNSEPDFYTMLHWGN